MACSYRNLFNIISSKLKQFQASCGTIRITNSIARLEVSISIFNINQESKQYLVMPSSIEMNSKHLRYVSAYILSLATSSCKMNWS